MAKLLLSHGNRLLARLPQAEHHRLSQYLEPVSLKHSQTIYKVRAPFKHVYFPASGIVSAMTIMKDGSAIEVATIGNEGMTGLTAFAGGETSPYEVMVQVPGEGWRMTTDDFHRETGKESALRRLLVLYNTAFAMQVSYSVACNGLHKIEKRCCRWLLMTQDRVGSNTLQLTHEFLSIMLGVRRASVTEVLRPLQEQKLVSNSRGKIEILNRAGLEERACECYQAVNNEFDRLFGTPSPDGKPTAARRRSIQLARREEL
jgi:CRP-like cAMP-binding protein